MWTKVLETGLYYKEEKCHIYDILNFFLYRALVCKEIQSEHSERE